MQVLLTGGTLVQLIFWTILLAWLALSADTITVMQLCCCCRCRCRLAWLFFFFPCALQFAFEAPTHIYTPHPPLHRRRQLPGSAQACPPPHPPGTGKQDQLGIGGSHERASPTRVCMARPRVHMHGGITPRGHWRKQAACKSFGGGKRAGWGKRKARKGGSGSPARHRRSPKGSGKPSPLAGEGGGPWHWHGDGGQLCKISPLPTPTWHFGHGAERGGNFTGEVAAAKLPRLISPLGLQ